MYHLVQKDSKRQRNAIGSGNGVERKSPQKGEYHKKCSQNPAFKWKELLFQIGQGVKTFFIIPLKEFAETIGKKRDNNLRRLLIVQILAYSVYWSVTEYGSILYLYMLKVRTQFMRVSLTKLRFSDYRNYSTHLHSKCIKLSIGNTSRYLTHLKQSSLPSLPWREASST